MTGDPDEAAREQMGLELEGEGRMVLDCPGGIYLMALEVLRTCSDTRANWLRHTWCWCSKG